MSRLIVVTVACSVVGLVALIEAVSELLATEVPREMVGCMDCNELRCTQANYDVCAKRLVGHEEQLP